MHCLAHQISQSLPNETTQAIIKYLHSVLNETTQASLQNHHCD